MNKRRVIIFLLVVLAVGGAVAWKKAASDKPANNTETAVGQPLDAEPVANTSIVVNITDTPKKGLETKALLEYDQPNDILRFTNLGGSNYYYLYYSKNAYYFCVTEARCTTSSAAGTAAERQTFEYTADELAELKRRAHYQDKKTCVIGDCDTWKITNGDVETWLYIDPASKRIVQAELVSPSKTLKATYEYKAVSLSLPANAISLPKPTQ